MPELQDIHVSKPLVLEIGECSVISVKGIGPDGKLFVLKDADLRLEIERPDVAVVDGATVCAEGVGETFIHAIVESNGRSITRSWKLCIINRHEARHKIIPSRPRVWFTSTELSEFQKRISGSAFNGSRADLIDFTELWKSLLEKADQYVLEKHFQVKYPSASHIMDVNLPLQEPDPIPNPEGFVDYPFWTIFSRHVEERLQVLSTAYLVTGERKYADTARDYLLGLADFSKWYEYDHAGAEWNLSNAHLLFGASMAYDAIQSLLPVDERQKVADAILYRGLQPLAVDFGNEDMHNIVTAKQTAMMFGAAALFGETPYGMKYMDQSFDYILSYLDRKLHSSETEGLLYNNVAAKHILMAADLFRRVTGDASLCNHPYLRQELPEHFFRFLSPGSTNSFPILSDSFYNLDLSYLMSMLASHHDHPAAMWYVGQFEAKKLDVLMNLRHLPEPLSPDDYYGAYKSKSIFTIGWASLRSGWKENDHLLCFTSSASVRDHTHKDQNNIMLNVAGEWLLTNPGYQDYVPGPRADYTVGTIGHNSLLIGGQGQRLRGGGKLSSSWLEPAFQAVQGDASESYDGLLESYVRTVFHVDESYYLLWDEVRSEEEQTAELLFHTTSPIWHGDKKVTAGETLSGQEVLIRGDKAALQLAWIVPQSPEVTVCEVPGAEEYGPHLSLKSGRSRRHRFITLLCPQTTDEKVEVKERAELAGGGIGIVVCRHNGIRDTFLFGASGEGGETRPAVYDGITIQGEAAWFVRSGDDAKAVPSRWALWKGTEMSGTGTESFRLRASRPVNAMLISQDGVEVLSVQAEYTTVLHWSGSNGGQSEWTLEPGIHRLELKWTEVERVGSV